MLWVLALPPMLVTESNFAECMEVCDRHRRVDRRLVVDTESTGLRMWSEDRMIGTSIKAGPHSFYFPYRHDDGNLPEERLQPLVDLLSDPGCTYVGFNLSFDFQMLAQDGVPLPKLIEDAKFAAHLMNEEEPSFALKNLGDKYLGKGAAAERDRLEELMLSRGLTKGGMRHLHPGEVAPYACKDVELPPALIDFYRPHLTTWKIDHLFNEMNEYQVALVNAEYNGLLLDQDLCLQFIEEAKREEARCEAVIREMAGYDINLRSAPQLQRWLGVPSTAAEYLEKLGREIPGKTELQLCRAWHRSYANYLYPFLEFVDPRTSILHPNMNPIGTVTGRISTSDNSVQKTSGGRRSPPLLALPRAEPEPPFDAVWRQKEVLGVPEGEEAWEADFSTAELRVGSHYANERKMQKLLDEGADLHQSTADDITRGGIRCSRQIAKNVNFSVFYGIGKDTLGDRYLNGDRKTAKAILDKYHGIYPGIRALYRHAERLASTRGYIRMYTGRLQHFRTARSPSHKASSRLVQGSVGEMIRIACTRIHKELPEVKLRLQVYDSIWFSTPPNRPDLIREVERIMVDQPWCTTKHRIDFKRATDAEGRKFGLAKKYRVE